MEDHIRETFNDLVVEHQASLRAFIRALGVDASWVDDIAQEAFVIAYKRFDIFEKDKSFGKWLRGIARNIVANERRKNARHARILDGVMTTLLMEQSDPCEALGSRELIDAMNECVGQLPDEKQQLLRSRYQEGKRASILAGSLNRTPVAIRNMLMRIRMLVQQCIERKLGEQWI